jgi:hypothetical protein
MNFKKPLLIVAFFSCAYAGWTQGCSDAGFCTIGPLRQTTLKDTAKWQSLSIGMAAGQGDGGVLVLTPYLQYDWQVNNRWALQTKITANYANGNLGNAFGAGDAFVTATHRKILKSRWQLMYTAGVKLPFNGSDLSFEGRPLPMQYQSSLGTIDAIAGITFANRLWQFSAGAQVPLSGENKNGFLPEFWNNSKDALEFPPSYRLLRKSDLLLRVSRTLVNKSAWQMNAGLLGIYHVADDEYMNPLAGSNSSIALVGSKGLTLNATAHAVWQLNNRAHIGLTAAAPLVVREVRPDGLTRSWVIAPEFVFRF